jgi:hypothetical protein
MDCAQPAEWCSTRQPLTRYGAADPSSRAVDAVKRSATVRDSGFVIGDGRHGAGAAWQERSTIQSVANVCWRLRSAVAT